MAYPPAGSSKDPIILLGPWNIPICTYSTGQGGFNTYLNFHRPCGFATETVDKIKKKYETYPTPFKKLNSLTHREQFLKEGVTLEKLEKIARSHNDTEYAKFMQQKKAQLFRSFSKPDILT